MSNFNVVTGFNEALTMNRVQEVHPNQEFFIKTLGPVDYQTNLLPITNGACGCGIPKWQTNPSVVGQDKAHAWNIDYPQQPYKTSCPYVMNMSTQPGDTGMGAFCAYQE